MPGENSSSAFSTRSARRMSTSACALCPISMSRWLVAVSRSERAICPSAPKTKTRTFRSCPVNGLRTRSRVRWRIMEKRLDFGQGRIAAILVVQDRVGCGDSPIDAETRIIPCNAALAIGGPIVGNPVNHLAISRQGHVPMCETRRQPQLLPVGGRKLNGDVAAVTRGSLADVDADIQYRSPDATHQLALGVGRDLEMQPPQHAPLRRMDVVLLHELLVQPFRGQSVPTIGLGEKAPVIGAPGRDHRENIRDIKPFDLHLGHFRAGASYRFRRRSCRAACCPAAQRAAPTRNNMFAAAM